MSRAENAFHASTIADGRFADDRYGSVCGISGIRIMPGRA